MKKKSKPKKHLLDSAGEFLVEAFASKYRAKKPSFAIVHAVTAAELVLKERLARVHPNLIYKNIDGPNVAKKQTVSLYDLPSRLLNLGVKIKQHEVELVHQCANWRNQIVHHLPDFDPKRPKFSFQNCLILSLRSCDENFAQVLRRFFPQIGTGRQSVFWRIGSTQFHALGVRPKKRVTYCQTNALTVLATAFFVSAIRPASTVIFAAQTATGIKTVPGAVAGL